MKSTEHTLDLQAFFPEELLITDVQENKDSIDIFLKSHSHSCCCPKCFNTATERRGTYTRTVQDLPILGKNTVLHINAYEYKCGNENCNAKSVAEDFSGFLDRYRRMTTRCLDFTIALALETSCEGAARIMNKMGVKISGDTIIRLLLREYKEQPKPTCGAVIGVDDFASRKRFKYCTVVVDEEKHTPLAVLEGRDGESLREWLKNNKHVKAVTRDRASAYAKVISEELPDAMQIADRFHLHDNLLTAIKKALNSAVPDEIKIPRDEGVRPSTQDSNTETERRKTELTQGQDSEEQVNGAKSADDVKKERIS